MDIKMNLFKKKEKNKPTNVNVVYTDGSQETVTMYSYLIYNRETNNILGAIKLTEDQAEGLNAYMRSLDLESIIEFVNKYNIKSFNYEDNIDEKHNLISAVHLLGMMNRKYENDPSYQTFTIGPCYGVYTDDQVSDIMKLDMGIMIKGYIENQLS